MRRLLFALVLVLTAAGAGAQSRVSDLVLSDDGTMFTVEVVRTTEYESASANALDTTSTSILRLRIQREDSIDTVIVPGSLMGGHHIAPSLAWDENDSRLYIFWQRQPGLGSSELLFTSYKAGVWTNTSTFDGGIWRLRFNLKVAITRFATKRMPDGRTVSGPALIAHAIWWEQMGQRESARYAMLELEQGAVKSIQIHELTDFVTRSNPEPAELEEGYDRSVFRTPFLFEAAAGDSVDVLFADWYTNRYQLVTITPIEDEKNGVMHIPIGVTAGEFGAAPIRFRDTNNAELHAIRTSPTGGTIVLYTPSDEAIDYTELREGQWTSRKVLMLNEALSTETALEGLRQRAARR